jgi:transcriptional regulator with XRE-family HTH domain
VQHDEMISGTPRLPSDGPGGTLADDLAELLTLVDGTVDPVLTEAEVERRLLRLTGSEPDLRVACHAPKWAAPAGRPRVIARLGGAAVAALGAAVEPEPQAAATIRLVEDPHSGGPTVRRVLLGARLHRLRRARGLSTEEAGEAVRRPHVEISRMESGQVALDQRDVADLLGLYGVDDPVDRAPLLRLAHESPSPGWWHHYGDVLSGCFQTYLELEEAASLVRLHAVQFVPGPLQTEQYARAVARLRFPDAREMDMRRHIDVWRRRQERFTGGPGAPRLWAILDESVLHRLPGEHGLLRGQLEQLLLMAARPNVTLQIVPFGIDTDAAMGTSFTLLHFAEPVGTVIAFMEQLTSALYLDRSSDVEVYERVMDGLSAVAAPPEESVHILGEMLGDEVFRDA